MISISEAFAPLIGLPSWLVRKGHGSFVTLEFGQPTVEVREPAPRQVFIEGAPERLMTRFTRVGGQWHLWIYCCAWSLRADDVELAHCESDDTTIARALAVLEGQALKAVAVQQSDGSTTFTFDLGCRLITSPAAPGIYEYPAEQWILYEPDGSTLTMREGGSAQRSAANAR